MVVSSACIKVASITVAVIIPRLMTALPAAVLAMSGSDDRGDVAPQFAQRASMAVIDRDFDAHAGAQREAFRDFFEGKPHWDALHHLDPVAGRVLRRQQREYRTARRRQRRDPCGDVSVRIGVDGDLRRIALPDIGELGLLDVGLDIEIVRRYQRKCGLACIEKGSDRDALDIIGNAVERRDDRGEAQVACRRIDRRLRLFYGGLLVNGQVRIAAELGQSCRGFSLQTWQSGLPRLQIAYRGVERGPRPRTGVKKMLLAVVIDLRKVDTRLGLIDLLEP